MDYLPEDLLQYLRSNKLGFGQRRLIRELVSECRQNEMSGPEYASRYVKRMLKIHLSLNSPLAE
ncbi:MAG: hypothetical protein ABFD54_04180 [Armatimonadota bacterium]|nr:hypothetical protein [bacterium]